ncbi:MAG: UDP-glucose 6-dehydrogenase, partial [Lutispora sp.]|nr:UDP-glucose 6-dehydrogenase [Lutispora sp.]
MNISIIGTGYVGLVSGVCLAYKEHRVICVDKNQSIVDSINTGIAPIYETHLNEMLADAINKDNLTATTDLVHAVMNSEI